jgi:cellulose synthase/poly-beta-1,6-N-acetylglucosamine synthase-like glycosyltransferase
MEKYPVVSVIVPVRNREDDIQECLDSLIQLDYPSFEMIVVEDGSTDKTLEIISHYPVRVLETNGEGAYAARNRGIQVAKGEIVAFTDSDCVVDKGWLKNLVECYSNDRVGGAGGRVLTFKSDRLVGTFQGLGPQEIFDAPKQVQLGVQNTSRFLSTGLGSGNMSFRLSVLKEVNGFSEDMTKCGDYELCWRIQRAGYRLVYEPKAVAYHKPRSSIVELVTQFFQWGMSQPQLLKKQEDGYSYFELKTYLFPTRGFRRKLPIQMLVTVDFFNLATLSLILVLVNPQFLFLFVVFGIICLKQAWTKTKEITSFALRAELLLVFPFLHALRSYAYSLGRFVGGLTCKILSV